MIKCYSYIRFSTLEQSSGDSYRRQLASSKKYADDNDLIFDESLTIKDLGVSAYKKHNVESGALSIFLLALKEGKIEKGSVLIVESLDRLSRANVMTALSLFTSIIEAGITIVTTQDNQKYSTESVNDNWTQLIISLSIMSRSHEEIKLKTERITSAWANKATKLKDGGLWSKTVPLWLKVESNKIVQVPERVKVVKKVFDMYINGYGQLLIAKHLNDEGIPSARGGKWWKRTIIDIIKNRAVMGYMTPKLKGQEYDEIADYYPKIISDETFYKAQSVINSRKVSGQKVGATVNSLFSSIIHCGKCGGAMGYDSRGKNEKRLYRATLDCNAYRHTAGCVKNSLSYDKFEMNFLYMINEIDLNSLFKNDDEVDECGVIQGKLVVQRSQLVKYETAIEEMNDIPKLLIKKITQVEANIDKLEAEFEDCKMKEHSHKPETLHFTDEIITKLQNRTSSLSVEALFDLRLKTRQLIQQVVKSITVHAYPSIISADVEAELRSSYDTAMVDEYINTEFRSPLQYIVELKNGMKQHVLYDPNEPEICTITKKWA